MNCQMHDVESNSTCGRPNWTNSSDLCEKHFKSAYGRVYDRIKNDNSQLTEDERLMADVMADNASHSLAQMHFAFGLMWKMRKALGLARLEQWFRHAYGKNPLVNQAWDQIAGMVWRDETGLDPISGAFEEIGF